MWILSIALLLGATVSPARATTLQKLGLDEIIRKSTSIVRAKVVGSSASLHGQDIYTYYQLQVLEDFKPGGSPTREVAVPGGAARGLRQTVPGAPSLNAGDEYVFFLWTGPSGMTQVIGLTQGLLAVTQDASGEAVVERPATSELMLDKSGRPVSDQAVRMSISDLRARIQKTLAGQ